MSGDAELSLSRVAEAGRFSRGEVTGDTTPTGRRVRLCLTAFAAVALTLPLYSQRPPRFQDARSSPAAGEHACDSGALCDGTTGLCEPARYCTRENPCENGLVGVARQTVDEPLTVPLCRTTVPGRAPFDDGTPVRWVDPGTGLTRAACLSLPSGASRRSRRPLVVFLHGSGGSADAIYNYTSLRTKAAGFNLTGDGDRTGFVLAADQGPNQEDPNGNPPASRHLIYLRDFSEASRNPDVRAIDHLIDMLVATGTIDPDRIYLMGWSNGAMFAQLYGIFRHQHPTAGGNRVAAVAVFEGSNPFLPPGDSPPACAYRDLPSSTLPLYQVHRDCSIVACDPAQNTAQGNVTGSDIETWIGVLRDEMGSPAVKQVMINAAGRASAACVTPAACGSLLALVNHLRWPDGVADGSGVDYESDMLAFLGHHPLPAARRRPSQH